MDSNTQHPKKRIRDHQQDTNLVNSPGANKKARRDTQPPLHNNHTKTTSDSWHSLHNYVDSWLDESLPQPSRSRRYSDSQLDTPDTTQQQQQESSHPPKSLPDMSRSDANRFDAQGYAIPSPPSVQSRGRSNSGLSEHTREPSVSSSSRGQSLVERWSYRSQNLRRNGIEYGRRSHTMTPEQNDLMGRMNRPRDSPEPTAEELLADQDFNDVLYGAEESKVADYFKEKIANTGGSSRPVLNKSLQIQRQHLPSNPALPPDCKLSCPAPDSLYGYSDSHFSRHGAQLAEMPTLAANTQGLLLPFFAVEFKAQGPSSNGNLWVAENQAMGASVACVRIAEQLNKRLEECSNIREVQKIDTSAFSIAMNGTEARLFITWRETPERYLMKHVKSYLVSEPDHYLQFRRVVRNILDWGKDERLRDIYKCFDSLLEESRLQASKVAKDRSRPGSSSGSDVSRRRQQ